MKEPIIVKDELGDEGKYFLFKVSVERGRFHDGFVYDYLLEGFGTLGWHILFTFSKVEEAFARMDELDALLEQQPEHCEPEPYQEEVFL